MSFGGGQRRVEERKGGTVDGEDMGVGGVVKEGLGWGGGGHGSTGRFECGWEGGHGGIREDDLSFFFFFFIIIFFFLLFFR